MVAMILAAMVLFGAAEAKPARKAPAKTAPPAPRPPPPAAPPADAPSAACPLDGLPGAVVAWDDPGHLWLLEDGDVLYVTGIGGALPRAGTTMTCAQKALHIEVVSGGANLSLMAFDLDFTPIVALEGPRRTPEAKAWRAAKRALEAGDLPGARLALRPLDRADEEVAELWLWISRLEAEAGNANAAHEALRGLPLELRGVPQGHVHASRASLGAARATDPPGDALLLLTPAENALRLAIPADLWSPAERLDILELSGRLRLVLGDPEAAAARLEQVVTADPSRSEAWLALGDARWAASDKRRARVAYLEAAARLPPEGQPPTLAERCPRCR